MPHPMETAPRDGTRILVDAELASDDYASAFNGWVIVRWDTEARAWMLSPVAPGTRLDGEPTGWYPLPS